jgi:hypothetical protein
MSFPQNTLLKLCTQGRRPQSWSGRTSEENSPSSFSQPVVRIPTANPPHSLVMMFCKPFSFRRERSFCNCKNTNKIFVENIPLILRRSQWPRGLRNELSSPAQTLGSWVRIPLEAWMFVCVHSVFVLSCKQVVALRRADSPPKEFYRLCKRSRN